MAKARHKKQAPEPARAAPPYAWSAAIVLAVLVFYWTPLTSADASIQWDAPVDGALIGITVPPAEGELELRFRSTYFAVGAAISALTALALLTLAFRI